MHWWLPLLAGLTVVVLLITISNVSKKKAVDNLCAALVFITIAATVAAIISLWPPTPTLSKAEALHYSNNVAKAATILTESTPDATLASTLVADHHQLISSTYATEIIFVGETASAQYFHVRVANWSLSPFGASTCLIASTSSSTYRVTYGACKVPKNSQLVIGHPATPIPGSTYLAPLG